MQLKRSGYCVYMFEFSRAYVYTRRCARLPTAIQFFCCHKCHTKAKTREGCGLVLKGIMRRVKQWKREEDETNLEIQGSLLIISVLIEKCDTCDSKKDKTPVMCAYARE